MATINYDIGKFEPPIIYIDPIELAKMHNWVDLADGEIGGVGISDYRDGAVYVSKILLIKQEVTHGDFELDDEALGAAYFEFEKIFAETGVDYCGRVLFWWHSHVHMGVHWSVVDTNTMDRLTNPKFLLSMVVNKRREYRLRFDTWEPIRIAVDDLPYTPITTLDEETKTALKVEFEEKVTKKVSVPHVTTARHPTFNRGGGFGGIPVHHYLGRPANTSVQHRGSKKSRIETGKPPEEESLIITEGMDEWGWPVDMDEYGAFSLALVDSLPESVSHYRQGESAYYGRIHTFNRTILKILPSDARTELLDKAEASNLPAADLDDDNITSTIYGLMETKQIYAGTTKTRIDLRKKVHALLNLHQSGDIECKTQ